MEITNEVLNTTSNRDEIKSVVNEVLLEAISTASIFKEYLTRNELLKYLGISNQCLYNWIDDGLIVPYYLGSKPYFKLKEVLSSMKPKSNTLIEIKSLE